MKKAGKFFLIIILLLFLLSQCSRSDHKHTYYRDKGAEYDIIDYDKFFYQDQSEEIQLGFLQKPHTFNPYRAASPAEILIKRAVYSTLFYFDTINKKISPNLVDNYSVSKDGLVYNFLIKDQVYFSNGQQLTSEDVIASLQLINQKIPVISGINQQLFFQKINELQFIIHLQKEQADLIYLLTNYPIITQTIAKKMKNLQDFIQIFDDQNQKNYGSGPFLLKKISNNLIQLEKNPYYFKKDQKKRQLPYSSKITISFHENDKNLFKKIIDEKIDFYKVNNFQFAQIKEILAMSKSGQNTRIVNSGFQSNKFITIFN
ncbi:MAG: ABC transporter substrate-binding protein, partial [Spirochaetes bacterium]|nr:ABC transporter substrate-binding protein [Spirochaetota bacterium]